ncbi:MAG: hypothetical protein ABR961_13430 [Thermoanaerobaculaceae bacterium]
MIRRTAFALFVALCASAAAAQPVAQFLKGTVPGTLRYQVVIEGASRGEISGELGDLTNLDVLAGPILAQEIAWRGAQPVAITALTWVLRARTLGPIAVGPTKVRFGDTTVATNPVTGTALPSGRTRGDGGQPGLRVDLSTSILTIGEPLVVRFSVATPDGWAGAGWEIQAAFPDSWSERLPQNDGQLTAGRTVAPGSVSLGGWLVIPVHAGRLEIPPAVARAADAGAEDENPALPARTVTSAPASVDVVPLPPAPAPFSGAVGELEFSRRLVDSEPVAGELALLEIEVRGVGNLPLLDHPPVPLPAGVRSFPPEESHSWQASRRGLIGWRRWRIPLEASQPGQYELPQVTFCSYRPGKSFATHVWPALPLVVRPAPVSASPAPEPVRQPRPVTARLALLVAVAFVAGGVTMLAARRLAARRAPASLTGEACGDPTTELRSLQLAVEEWARTSWGVAVGEGPGRLAAAGCPAADAREAVGLVQACERLRFAPGLSNPADVVADLRLRVGRLMATRSRSADRLKG